MTTFGDYFLFVKGPGKDAGCDAASSVVGLYESTDAGNGGYVKGQLERPLRSRRENRRA